MLSSDGREAWNLRAQVSSGHVRPTPNSTANRRGLAADNALGLPRTCPTRSMQLSASFCVCSTVIRTSFGLPTSCAEPLYQLLCGTILSAFLQPLAKCLNIEHMHVRRNCIEEVAKVEALIVPVVCATKREQRRIIVRFRRQAPKSRRLSELGSILRSRHLQPVADFPMPTGRDDIR